MTQEEVVLIIEAMFLITIVWFGTIGLVCLLVRKQEGGIVMRLTLKDIYAGIHYTLCEEDEILVINKLGQLEDILESHNIETLEELDGLLWYVKQIKDIEEKLGIDLITLLRVQTIGAYFKGKDRKWIPMTDYKDKCFICMETEIYRFYFKDYGKTWALTKEELL